MRPGGLARTVTSMKSANPRQRMLSGLAAISRTVNIDGVTTRVIELGDGPPLVLLHGGIECGGAMWAPVLGRLARANRVVVPDVPGLGESDPLTRLDVDTFTCWLSALVERTGLERPTLVAARFAVTGSNVLSRLVIYAGPAVGPYRMPLRLRYVGLRLMLRPTLRNAERFDRYALLDLDATRQRDPGWYDAFVAYTLERATQRHVKKTMSQLLAEQTKPIPERELDRIDIPTSLLWGRHDLMVPLAIGKSAAARHGWPLDVIENAAHAPHIEQPEAFSRTLLRIIVPA
jgi:pimeloyl-ACP methyl ester carboxylesterase